MDNRIVIFGCGDVGLRLLTQLSENAIDGTDIIAVNRRAKHYQNAVGLAVDLDQPPLEVSFCQQAKLFYLVPPPGDGVLDLRSRLLLTQFKQHNIVPQRVVLISTTGVYGDCDGVWVDESRPTVPGSERAVRRLDAEQQWISSSREQGFSLVILRVPGIYANSRIPRQRLARRQPVVRSSECGYSNRIHADDLAQCMLAAMQLSIAYEVLNVSDGVPSTITDYLQAAAQTIGMDPLPEISLAQASSELSAGMLSYLTESRKISNRKMLENLKVTLRYPDFIKGLKHG